MSILELSEQAIELPEHITQALASIGYAVMAPPAGLPCPGCNDTGRCGYCGGLGWDPKVEGYYACPVCQGWRSCPCQPPVTEGEPVQ